MFAAAGNHVTALHRDRMGGLDLPATLLFDQPNIEAVARYVDEHLSGRVAQQPVVAAGRERSQGTRYLAPG